MNCIFICSVPISHIIPIQPLVEYLICNNVNVYVISSRGNEGRIKSYGAKFIEYPFQFVEEGNLSSLIERGKNFRELLYDEKYIEAFDYFIEKDTEYFYDHNFKNLELMFNMIKKLKPDFIIRDAVDRYGNTIAKLLNIPCIGMITHCLYSKKFFEENPSDLYRIFLDALNINAPVLDNYFKNLRKKYESIHDKVFMNSLTFKINTLHQFDPCEELTLINSIKSFQPQSSFEENRLYKLIYPKMDRFLIEKQIDSNLVSFIKFAKQEKRKIVYIATGSMLSLKFKLCTKLIDNLIKNGLCIIVSNNKEYEELRTYYSDRLEYVYVDSFLPQQFVLSNSDLFISSAGQNSILEAIYHEVPLLAIPITSEQKINGLMIEYNNIGLTNYIKRDIPKTFGWLVNELLINLKYKYNLKVLHDDLVNNTNDFKDILEYVYEKKKRIENFYIIR